MATTSNVGINPKRVPELETAISKSLKTFSDTIKTEIERNIITKASNTWFTPNGVKFFEDFNTRVKELESPMLENYNIFIKTMETAANYALERAGASTVNFNKVSDCDLAVNVSNIKAEKSDGSIAIDLGAMPALASATSTARTNITTKAKTLSTNISQIAAAVFQGNDQSTVIKDCFDRLNDVIAGFFKTLDEGENTLKGAIEKAATEVGYTTDEVKKTFNSLSS